MSVVPMISDWIRALIEAYLDGFIAAPGLEELDALLRPDREVRADFAQ